jgi:hypothetical protein
MHHGQLFSFGLVRRDGRRHWQSLRITSGQQSHATTRMEMIQLTAMARLIFIGESRDIVLSKIVGEYRSPSRASPERLGVAPSILLCGVLLISLSWLCLSA